MKLARPEPTTCVHRVGSGRRGGASTDSNLIDALSHDAPNLIQRDTEQPEKLPFPDLSGLSRSSRATRWGRLRSLLLMNGDVLIDIRIDRRATPECERRHFAIGGTALVGHAVPSDRTG
jgi:hypothetical protein